MATCKPGPYCAIAYREKNLHKQSRQNKGNSPRYNTKCQLAGYKLEVS